ncbi:MAG TPA: tripartite tricarboxylate transporter substrate binding protein [Burkholderiales bacterium]|jgi:tripartite-type tricarboxylate transporter receptor subunit TctC|nr:tripartite tricarboxylate transporter substrate binding protein [Burkholderiales bacterium]
MKRILLALGIVASLACQAQPWPSKPVRVIVNVAPGGVADVTARVLGARLQETLGQPFPVENRAGGDGYIGFDAVARSDPDGHTLLYSPGSSMMIAPHVVNRPDLDPLKVLAPVAATGRVSLYVLVHPERPFKNLAEFLAYARSNPGKLNYGTPGNGTSPHIATEVFAREAKVTLNHVPYKGAGPALKDLLGGQIDFAFDPGVGVPQAKAGKLRMIAIAGPSRHPDFPGVPTLEENGIKGVDGGPHFGFYAPTGTPRESIAKINSEIQKAMQDPTVSARFKALAVDVAEPMTPEQFAAYVRSEHARYAKLIPQLGIKP